MKYIIASDYDGTISRDGVISEKTIQGIKEFKEKGHIFGLVTGRDYVNGYLELKENDVLKFDFIIMNNGASACDRDGNIYFSEKINGSIPYGDTTLVREFVKKCLELTSDRCTIASEKSRLIFYPDSIIDSELDGIGDFVAASAICDTAEQATAVVEILKKEFGQFLNPMQNDRCIDVSPIGIDKAVGIEKLAELLGFSNDKIWTIGDNFNDITMVQKYHGCAVTNGVDALKDVAEFVCEDVYDVVKYILNK